MTKGDIVFAVLTAVSVVGEIVKLYGWVRIRARCVFNGRCVGMWSLIAAMVVLSNTRAADGSLTDMVEQSKLYSVAFCASNLVIAEIVLHTCAVLHDDNSYWKSMFNYRANKLNYREPENSVFVAQNDIDAMQVMLDGMERGEYGDGNKNLITLSDFHEFYGYCMAKTEQLKRSFQRNTEIKFGDRCKRVASFFLCLFPLYVIAACAAAVVFALV